MWLSGYYSSVLKSITVMKANEIIEYYKTVSDYAKNRVVTLVKDLYSAREESIKLTETMTVVCIHVIVMDIRQTMIRLVP